jgi:flagellar biosynthetic protein FlhB
MSTSSDDKQEKPTAKRLKDAKEKGQVASSREFGAAVGLCAVALALGWVGVTLSHTLAEAMAGDLTRLDRFATTDLTAETVAGLVADRTRWFASTLTPLLAVATLAAVAGFAMQGSVTWAPEALALKWERLAPSHGLSRLAPSKSGADLVRAFFALVVVGWVTVPVGQELLGRAPELVALPPAHAAAVGWDAIWRLLWRGGLALLGLGAADFLWQRWNWLRGLRMSKQEIRDEMKQQEGSPEVKSRVRRIQREMARARMMQQVPSATVVVTNPTHYAVALRYQRERMAAPIVVAKGADAVAARIRAIARDANVPIIENPPLARALHAGVEIGDPIPAELFTAVAEVLAYLVRIKQLVF